MRFRLLTTIVFYTIFIMNNLSQASILAGTVIKTPKGRIPIEQLRINDKLIAYDSNKTLIQSIITHISTSFTTKYDLLSLELYKLADPMNYISI